MHQMAAWTRITNMSAEIAPVSNISIISHADSRTIGFWLELEVDKFENLAQRWVRHVENTDK